MRLSELFERVIFLTGAGASKGAGCKLSQEMLCDLRKSFNNLDPTQREQYEEIYRYFAATLDYQDSLRNHDTADNTFKRNIEDFVLLLRKVVHRDFIIPYPLIGSWSDKITRLESANPNVFKDFLDYIEQKLIQEWIRGEDRSGTEKMLSPINNLLAVPENFRMDVFTLNYDLVMERFFNKSSVLNVNTGFIQGRWADDFSDGKKEHHANESKINYYKIHGSLDWYRDVDVAHCSESHIIQDRPFLIFGQENKMLSIEPFFSLLVRFRKRLDEATHVISIGYSFFDPYINNLIISSVNNQFDKKLIIVDPGLKDCTPDKFVEKLKIIQGVDIQNGTYNLSTLDSSRVHIIPQRTDEFYWEYLSDGARKLKELVEIQNPEDQAPF